MTPPSNSNQITCFKCKGTGMMDKPIESGIKSGVCKSCRVVVYGSTIERLEKHGGYCYECSGAYDGKRDRPDEVCSFCNKKWREH